MNPHQTETTILAFSVAFLLGLLTSSVIDWAFKEKPQTEFHSEGQRIHDIAGKTARYYEFGLFAITPKGVEFLKENK